MAKQNDSKAYFLNPFYAFLYICMLFAINSTEIILYEEY